MAGAATRAAGRDDRLAVHVAVGVRRLAGVARTAGRDDRRRRGAVVSSTQRVRDRRLAAVRRRARRPGAVRTRMARAPRLRARPRRTHLRRHADLRLPRRRRPPRAPRAVPGRRRRGRPAGSVREDRAAVGQPALRLDGDAPKRLPVVDRALPPRVRPRRPDARRPLPRLRLLLGGAGGEHDGRRRQVAPRAWRRRLPRGRA